MPNKKPKNQLNKFARFTGVAFQMGATIFAGNWLGKYIDQTCDTNYENIITLLAVFASMYLVIIQVIKASKE